jgi:hypothetical protein
MQIIRPLSFWLNLVIETLPNFMVSDIFSSSVNVLIVCSNLVKDESYISIPFDE